MPNVATRAEIAEQIDHAFDYPPVSRAEILEAAVRAGARPEVLDVLNRLPADRNYRSLRDLWADIPETPVSA
jgi:hypothetical protein